MRGNKHYLELKKNCNARDKSGRNPNYGVKASGFYEKGKGNNYMKRRKEFLLVLTS